MGAGVGSGLWLLGGLVRPGRVPAWVRGRTPAILLGLLAAGGAVVPFLPQVLPLGSAVSGRAWVAWLAAVAFPWGPSSFRRPGASDWALGLSAGWALGTPCWGSSSGPSSRWGAVSWWQGSSPAGRPSSAWSSSAG